MTHRFEVRVYFEDTDFSGNVYHAAYLKFFERGRTEWLRARGFHHSALLDEGKVFAVRQLEIFYDAPAKIDDLLVAETRIAKAGRARVVLEQALLRDGETLTRAMVTVVMLSMDGRPLRLPQGLAE